MSEITKPGPLGAKVIKLITSSTFFIHTPTGTVIEDRKSTTQEGVVMSSTDRSSAFNKADLEEVSEEEARAKIVANETEYQEFVANMMSPFGETVIGIHKDTTEKRAQFVELLSRGKMNELAELIFPSQVVA